MRRSRLICIYISDVVWALKREGIWRDDWTVEGGDTKFDETQVIGTAYQAGIKKIYKWYINDEGNLDAKKYNDKILYECVL